MLIYSLGWCLRAHKPYVYLVKRLHIKFLNEIKISSSQGFEKEKKKHLKIHMKKENWAQYRILTKWCKLLLSN